MQSGLRPAFFLMPDDEDGDHMNKRNFIAAALCGASSMALAAGKDKQEQSCIIPEGPVLLTLTGAITRSNRGALDGELDQMMAKQKIQFDRAYTFDFGALATLPQTIIEPTLEYDGKPHLLQGPLLIDVLAAAGALGARDILLRAIDGYVVSVSFADVSRLRFIIATHMDGKPMPLGGLGPLWAVYDADRLPDKMELPLGARYTLCPWGIFHIEARA